MNERTASILEAAIGEFISSGEPVSSGLLYERYDFGIRPAMIRMELEKLSDSGFLQKQHHSAGRVPEDKGYEFYAGRILEESDAAASLPARNSLLARGAFGGIAEKLASELGVLGAAGSLSEGCLFKDGLEGLVECLEQDSAAGIASVIRDFEELDRRFLDIEKTMDCGTQVFVGRKSPVTKSENLSVMIRSCGKGRACIMAIGPKRMDYKKALRALNRIWNPS